MITAGAVVLAAIVVTALWLGGAFSGGRAASTPKPGSGSPGASASNTGAGVTDTSEPGGGEISDPRLSPRPPTPYNPDATSQGAASTATEVPVSGSIPGSGGHIQVNAPTNISLTPDISGLWLIYTSNSGRDDPYLEIYDRDNVLIGYDDDGAGGFDAFCGVFFVAGETYRISAKCYADEKGSYTITAQPPETFPGSGGDVRVNGRTAFLFTPDRSGTWTFRTSGNRVDPWLAVYDAVERIAYDEYGAGDNHALITVNLTAGEIYDVSVGFWDGGEQTVQGVCTLSITFG